MEKKANNGPNWRKRIKWYGLAASGAAIFAGGYLTKHYTSEPEYYGNIKLSPDALYDIVGRESLVPRFLEKGTGFLFHPGEKFYPLIQQPDGSFKPLSEIEEGEWNSFHKAFKQQKIETEAEQNKRFEGYKQKWRKENAIRKTVPRKNDLPKNGTIKNYEKVFP
ncbi:MAG TPA: hypothetical protein VJ485_01195 [archaeon]|jgi:hypothetical protein|nr:hypothetical protein [archaeon]